MPKNYLIGIGGTGARVIEAAINLCAAGYGPDELSIFLIDPDAGNGNLTRTKTAITNYIKCRNNLQRTVDTPIFKTHIKIPPDEKGLVWEIFSDKGATLSNFINFENIKQTEPALAEFASILFSRNELNTELDEGFRGHPSIGAVVMSNPPQDTYPFKMLFDDLAAGNRKPNDLRVFLVGSVFGGTGAAGFPTLGSKQIIKFNPFAKLQENVSQILLGGALLLPYFNFDTDQEAEKNEQMFVTGNDFPIATKAALQYYNEKDLGFDQIYFIGDSLAQKVGKFSTGAKTQENLPHYIEIVSALAAFDFYEQPEIKGETEKMFFTACRDNKELSWSDLPVSRDPSRIREKQTLLKTLLTDMTVFAYAFLTYGKYILDTKHSNIMDAWYKDHFRFNEKEEKDKAQDPRQLTQKDTLDIFSRFLNNFIFWVAAMDDHSNKVNLIDRSMLVNGELEVGKSFTLISPQEEATKRNIGFLLKHERGNRGGDLNDFKIKGLNSVDLYDKKLTEAASKFITVFYQGASKYNRINYNVN